MVQGDKGESIFWYRGCKDPASSPGAISPKLGGGPPLEFKVSAFQLPVSVPEEVENCSNLFLEILGPLSAPFWTMGYQVLRVSRIVPVIPRDFLLLGLVLFLGFFGGLRVQVDGRYGSKGREL
jgi:hypothetical protein